MKRKFCCVLALLLILEALSLPAFAEGSEKAQTTRSIAIVFDNSGSMYIQNNKAWCRATYAMEVFAAMMNEGDTMAIYPMHQVTIDGKEYDGTNPVVISGPKDAMLIRKMYTPDAQDTPIETIDAAYEGLKKTNGEQWLIVLTDGDTFYEDGQDLQGQTSARLTEILSQYNQNVNVMYLGIGTGAAMPSMSGGAFQYYGDKASDSAQVLSKLTYMCNIIFGRDTMDIGDNGISMDVSMKKIILFVQGKNVSDISVTDAGGTDIGQKGEEYSTKYSQLGAGGPNQGNAVDENLQGMIVTYENCRAGEYQLSYSGDVSSAVAYYEPDVDLVVQLIDEKTGAVIDGTETAYAGDYTLRYGLKDNQTGQLTQSDLLGNTHYEINYTVNGESFTASSDKKEDELTVTLEAGNILDATISADYLSGYHIEKSGPDFGWPEGGFRIEVRSIDPDLLSFQLSGGQSQYGLSQVEQLGHYTLTASYNGQPLTNELLERYVPQVEILGGNIGYDYVASSDKSGYEIFLKYHEDALHTDCGEYTLNYNVLYTNEDGQSGTGVTAQQTFTVTNDGYGLEADLERTQAFYRLSELDQGEPLVLHLTKDGQKLSDEELAAVELQIDSDGIPYETQIMEGQSAYAIQLKSSDQIATGRHTISCKASATDAIGQSIQAEDKATIEIQKYPLWMRWLMIALILALLLLLLLLFLNQKVLPKSVRRNGETDFNIGGKTIEDNAKIAYKRQARTLDINPPDAPIYPYVSCAAKLTLEPVSPRRVPSAKRKMKVTAVRANPDVTSVEVGASVYELDKATGKFVKEGGTPTVLSNNSVITVNGTALNSNGRKKTAILSQQLRFK